MNTFLNNLQVRLNEAALEHYRAGAIYYSSLEKSSKKTRQIASERYRSSAENYSGELSFCEQALLSVERDEDMERELKRLQSLLHSIRSILQYL
jgi:hypothetical protein